MSSLSLTATSDSSPSSNSSSKANLATFARPVSVIETIFVHNTPVANTLEPITELSQVGLERIRLLIHYDISPTISPGLTHSSNCSGVT